MRHDLHLPPGKLSCQVGHAVLQAYKQMQNQQQLDVVQNWELFGEMKIVLKVKSEQELRELESKVIQ